MMEARGEEREFFFLNICSFNKYSAPTMCQTLVTTGHIGHNSKQSSLPVVSLGCGRRCLNANCKCKK